MDPFFAELGRTVFARWKKVNFSLAEFPRIAQEALEKRPPARHVDLPGLMRGFLLEEEQPAQSGSDFGQPELIVYDNPRFYIQVLFWLEGTMEIHQHEFSGAFHVMAGSSIHSEFAFQNARAVSAHFRVGDLKLQRTELLETGTTVPIVSGSGHIHSLFHLDTPSVSVVVRTHNDPGTGPQFTYLPPHIAVDPFFSDPLTARRKELLDVMEKTGDPAYAGLVLKMLGDLDFERGFFILQSTMGHLAELGKWERAWKVFERKHAALAAKVKPTLEEIAWRDGPVGLRSSVTSPEHRFFLALLLNVPEREAILDLVEARYAGDPVETVLRWAEELSDASGGTTWILDAEFPLEMRVLAEEQEQVFFAALRYFLEGAKAKLPRAEAALFRAAFARSSLRALVS